MYFYVKFLYFSMINSCRQEYQYTSSVPISKHRFIRGKKCLYIRMEGVFGMSNNTITMMQVHSLNGVVNL